MSRLVPFTLAMAGLLLGATAGSAQPYPLTNGPNGAGTNTPDSVRGFSGLNAVAPERELIYHPERGGNAAAQLGITAAPVGGIAADDAPASRPPRRRHAPPR